jgi:hypothetical protein
MMNVDQARAGGEGMASAKIEDKDKPDEVGPDLFQSKEQKVKVQVPDGWHAKEP